MTLSVNPAGKRLIPSCRVSDCTKPVAFGMRTANRLKARDSRFWRVWSAVELVSGLLASFVPVRRVTKVDPVVADTGIGRKEGSATAGEPPTRSRRIAPSSGDQQGRRSSGGWGVRLTGDASGLGAADQRLILTGAAAR